MPLSVPRPHTASTLQEISDPVSLPPCSAIPPTRSGLTGMCLDSAFEAKTDFLWGFCKVRVLVLVCMSRDHCGRPRRMPCLRHVHLPRRITAQQGLGTAVEHPRQGAQGSQGGRSGVSLSTAVQEVERDSSEQNSDGAIETRVREAERQYARLRSGIMLFMVCRWSKGFPNPRKLYTSTTLSIAKQPE